MMPFTWDEMPRLQSARIVLRPLTPRDDHDLFAVYGDAEVMRFASEDAFPDVGFIAVMLASVQHLFVAQEALEWGVCLPTDQLIGTCGLHSFSADRREAEVGCLLAREYWGQGLMRVAVKLALAFGFTHLDLTTIRADIDSDNQRSRGLFARCGFQPVAASPTFFALSRERWLSGDGAEGASN